MSADRKPNSGTVILTTIVGIALMVGGFYVSKNVKIGFFEQLAEQGVPIDPGKTVAVIGVFLILFPIIRLFFIDPLANAINERNSALERTFAEAENLRGEMTAMKSDYEKRLIATEAEAREQIQAQMNEVRRVADARIAEVNSHIDEMKAKAQEEIEASRQKVLTELRLEVVNLTLAATEKILGENVDDAKNRRLIDEFIDKVEVKS